MNSKKTIIISRAGKIDGWGNFHRQYSLAVYLKERGHKINFIIIESKKAFKQSSKLFNSHLIKNDKNFKNKIINKVSKYKNLDYIIIELYKLDLDFQKKLFRLTNKLVVFDDLLNKNYFANILICCQENDNFKKFIKNKKNYVEKFYYGYKYFPICINKNFENKINKKIKYKIIISLGGGSYDNLYLKIFSVLKNYKKYYDEIQFFFSGEYNNKTIKYLDNFNYIKIYQNKNNILNYMNQANLLITSGGYHKIEANYLNKPIIAIATQKHQNQLLKNFEKKTNINFLKYNIKNFDNALNKFCKLFFVNNNKKLFLPKKIITNTNNFKIVDLLN